MPLPCSILMCAPDYYGVNYVINPWMENQIGMADHALASRQWEDLRKALARHGELTFVEPREALPDMVFTANAGLVMGKKIILSHFQSKERQAEEPYFQTWFEQNGFTIANWPTDIPFEGAGDALFDRGSSLLWVGHGFRSHPDASIYIAQILKRKTVALKLVDPRFYHLDTCFCPLEGGWLLYYPEAFNHESQEKIAASVPPEKRIAVSEADALLFACNAVDLNRHIFLNAASPLLQLRLQEAGFTPIITPLSEFLKAGGGAKCLTLKVVE